MVNLNFHEAHRDYFTHSVCIFMFEHVYICALARVRVCVLDLLNVSDAESFLYR